jgi:hypothetical protein
MYQEETNQRHQRITKQVGMEEDYLQADGDDKNST